MKAKGYFIRSDMDFAIQLKYYFPDKSYKESTGLIKDYLQEINEKIKHKK